MKERTTPSPYRCIRSGPGPDDYRLELRPGTPRLAAVPTTDAHGPGPRKTRDTDTKVLANGTLIVEVDSGKVLYAVGPITVSETPPLGRVDLGTVHTGSAEQDFEKRTRDALRERTQQAQRTAEINRRNAEFWARNGGYGPKDAA